MIVTVSELYRRAGRYGEPRTNRAALLALFLALTSAAMLASTGPLYRRADRRSRAGVHDPAMGGVRSDCHASGRPWSRWSSPMLRGTGKTMPVIAAGARRWRRLRSRCRSCDRPRVCRASTTSPPTPTSPPRFVSVVPLRAGAPNPVEYGGPELAAQQRQGYPDLQPLSLPLPPNQAFDRALATARSMRWEIVASDPAVRTDRGDRHHVLVRLQGRRRDPRGPRAGRQPRRCAIALPRRPERRGHQRRPHP